MDALAPAPTLPSRADLRNTTHQPRRGVGLLLRLPIALALIAAAIVLFATQETTRLFEVTLTSQILASIVHNAPVVGTNLADPIVMFFTPNGWVGLQVTAECAIAFYVAGILLFGALLTLIRRFALHRVLIATAVATTIMIVLNQARFAILSYVAGNHDHQTFDWVHSIGGSVLMIGGLAANLVLFFFLVVRRTRRERRV